MKHATRRSVFVPTVCIALCALSAACTRGTATSQDPATARDQRELAALENRRQVREQELKAMDVPRLAEQLSTDSTRGVEAFNSMAYREIVSRGASAAAPLKTALSTPNASSLLGLLALRQISASDYKSLDPGFRAQVLVDALRSAKFFNAWGIPHLSWEDAARALMEEGRPIEGPLMSLLDDRREAPVWGSEGAIEQRRYRYRVRDYAWALLNEVRGQRVPIPLDPAERDKLIEAGRK